jgi:hypothetical protein
VVGRMSCRVSAAPLYTISALDSIDTVQFILTLLVADLVVTMLTISTVVSGVRAHSISHNASLSLVWDKMINQREFCEKRRSLVRSSE